MNTHKYTYTHIHTHAPLKSIMRRNKKKRRREKAIQIFQDAGQNSERANQKCRSRHHLAEIRIQLCYGVTEPFHILGQKLVCICNAIVKVTHLVESETSAKETKIC